MEITEVRIKLMEDNHERLQAFCSVTFDDAFVVRDLRIIEGTKGSFVAMPSRKLTDRCPSCGSKNHLRARFCNQCGARLGDDRAAKDSEGRAKLHADIAHPINSGCRELIQSAVLGAYQEEFARAQKPGYVSCYEDLGDEGPTAARSDDEPKRREAEPVAAVDGNGEPELLEAEEEAAYEEVISRLESDDEEAPVHRVSPPGRPGGPHVGSGRPVRRAAEYGAERRREGGSGDGFGAGIL